MEQRRSALREALIRSSWAVLDGTWWALAVGVAVWLRYQYNVDLSLTADTVLVATAAALVHITAGCLFGPYLVGHIRGSFEEVVAVCRAAFITTLVMMCVALVAQPILVPRSVPVLAGALAIISMLASRFVVRTWRSHRAANRETESRVIVFGAGIAGRRLVHNMLYDGDSQFRPVALIDDDRSKRKLRVDGISVQGTREAIHKTVGKYDATHLVVAIPTADAALMREVRGIAESAQLHLKVLPTIDHILSGDPHVKDLRDIDLEDLLGRRAVELDQDAIAEQVTGRVVLVTGAGGSIGSELCRQIARYQPARLLLLERDESALHSIQLSLTGRGLLEGDDLLLADIRDVDALRSLFTATRPDIVFHAAALKHLSLLEKFPREAWQTNVLGTLNVLTAAAESGVGTFVNISTDKAASPTSVLGYSKRIAERLTADFAQSQPGRYVSVRFGNVLGSRGSVIPAFTEQIRQGGPVTVTHPEVERYFMLIPEACQLVLQSAAIGSDGEVMVLDMGTPIKIAEVAETLIQMSGRQDVSIKYTGLRPGEKITEILFNSEDERRSTSHPLVAAVDVPTLTPEHVRFKRHSDERALQDWLRSNVGERATALNS